MSTSDPDSATAQPRSLDESLYRFPVTNRREDLGLDTAYVAPAGATEIRIADAWEEALGIDTVGVDDDFFELGGDSLGLTHVLIEIRKGWDVEVPTEAFFDGPTVRQLAEVVNAAKRPMTATQDDRP